MRRRVDWNELDGQLSFAPGAKVLAVRKADDIDVNTVECVVECADGSIVVVDIEARTYVVPEQAPTKVRRWLRELGKLQ